MPGISRFQPIIIVGAGRSGTNMLRDLLCMAPGVNTWPCDEINYIWRHGNVNFASDEFSVELARPEVCRYIRQKFHDLSRRTNANFVVEKTCANSLRVDFVNKVVPEARFIFVVRHGIDVVASAVKRWTANIDLPYLARKARYVPVSDLPYYSSRYLLNRIYKIISGRRRLAYWGPKFSGFETYVARHSIEEVCAKQWESCVTKASDSLERIEPDRVLTLRYEDFVADPQIELDRILEFAGIGANAASIDTSNILTTSVGSGVAALGPHKSSQISAKLKDTLGRFGY